MQISLSSLVPIIQNYDCTDKKKCSIHTNLAMLSRDTVSFGSKKSDYQEIDLLVVNKFVPQIERFKDSKTFTDPYGLQTWCENQLCIYNKTYKARQNYATVERKKILNEWFSFLKNSNFNSATKLLIIHEITKDLKADNDTLPPVLLEDILKSTIDEISIRAKNNPKDLSFKNIYEKNALIYAMGKLVNEEGKEIEGNTGWVMLPCKANDTQNFANNVKRLKILSANSWCTKSFAAEKYLNSGDFHIYIENGKPKIGIRFFKDKIYEIQGEKNNNIIPSEYSEILNSHLQNYEQSK